MKKKGKERRTLERLLANEFSKEEMGKISASHSTGGMFTRSGYPEEWDDCKEEDCGGGGWPPDNQQ